MGRKNKPKVEAKRPENWNYKGDRAEKKFRLTMYYKVCGAYTLIVGLLFAAVRILRGKDYFLINASLEHWLWYALVIGALLLLGRYIGEMPSSQSGRKKVRVLVAIVTLCLLVVTYLQCIGRIDSSFLKYAVYTSPDGEREAVVMMAKLYGPEPADGEEQQVDVLYKAYPRINKLFYNGADYEDTENMIWLVNDTTATLQPAWSEDGKALTLTTAGNAMTMNLTDGTPREMNSLTLEFE